MQAVNKLPEKRTEILYSRITPKNKKFISSTAKQRDVSESVLVDHILDHFREQNAGVKKKARRSS